MEAKLKFKRKNVILITIITIVILGIIGIGLYSFIKENLNSNNEIKNEIVEPISLEKDTNKVGFKKTTAPILASNAHCNEHLPDKIEIRKVLVKETFLLEWTPSVINAAITADDFNIIQKKEGTIVFVENGGTEVDDLSGHSGESIEKSMQTEWQQRTS